MVLDAFLGAIRVVSEYGLAKGDACSGRASGLELGLVALKTEWEEQLEPLASVLILSLVFVHCLRCTWFLFPQRKQVQGLQNLIGIGCILFL
jgi:hypothetical protein